MTRTEAPAPQDTPPAGLGMVLDHLPDLAHVFDRQWRWVYMNEPARASLREAGHDPDVLMGTCVWELFPQAPTREPAERALREQREVVTETTVTRRDAIMETRIVPLADYVLTLSRDVTARHRLQQDLSRENAELDLERRRLRAILEILPVGVWIADTKGEILESNAAAAEIWGGTTPRSRDASRYHAEYPAWWSATGEPVGPGEWGLARAVARGEVSRGEEIDIEAADGARKTILNYAVPIHGGGGQIIGAIALSVDITDRRRVERRQQLLGGAIATLTASLDPESAYGALTDFCVERLADVAGTILIDEEGETRRVSVRHRDRQVEKALEPLLDLPAARLQRQPALRRLLESGQSLLLERIDAGVLRRLTQTPLEQRALEQLRLTSVMLVPLRVRDRTSGVVLLGTVEGGRPPYTRENLELALELGERAGIAIEHARLYQGAQAASQAKSQFLATMSHELRTPLTAIIGYDELLLNEIWGPVNDRQKQQLERIRVSAWHLVTIIDQILTFSRAEAGREEVQAQLTELTKLVEETTALLEPQALAKQVALHVHVPEAPLWAHTDPGKLRQILLNLAGNAVKFTDRGEVEITLAPDDGHVEVRIRDTGIGISPADQQKIFEPFTQLDQSNTRSQGGTGLGLTVSRRLARLLGGDVLVESERGQGSVFTLRLPLQRSSAPPALG